MDTWRRSGAGGDAAGGAPGSGLDGALGSATTARIVEALRERIASQQVPAGSRLRELALSREFGVSRSRIREAFGALEQRGLIERIPNRGAVVVRLHPAQFYNLFDVREMLEGLCARLATQKADPAHWADLEAAFGSPLEADVLAGRLESYLEAVERFRSRMLEAADNPELREALDSIQDKTRVLIRRIIILPGRAQQGLAEHRAVLAAMRAGDAEAAERLKRRNIRSSRAYLERYEHFLL